MEALMNQNELPKTADEYIKYDKSFDAASDYTIIAPPIPITYRLWKDDRWQEIEDAKIFATIQKGSIMKLLVDNPVPESHAAILHVADEKEGEVNLMAKTGKFSPTPFQNCYIVDIDLGAVTALDKEKLGKIILERMEKAAIKADGDIVLLDRRSNKRFKVALKINYQFIENNEWKKGEDNLETIDLSSGGMKIKSPRQIYKDNVLYLQMVLGQVPFYTMGRVIWAENNMENDNHTAGIEFVDISQNERNILLSYANSICTDS